MKKSVKFVALFLFLLGGLFNAAAQERLPQFLKHKVKPGETINSLSELYKINKYDLLLLNDFPEEVLLTTNQVVLIRLLKDGEEATVLPADYKDNSKTTTATTEKKTTTTTTTTAARTEEPKTEAPKKEQPKKEEPAAVKEEPKPVRTEAPVTAVVNKAETVGPDGTKYKVTESGYHTVEKGQTFYRISLIYGLTVDELKALNNLSSTTVAVGQKLKVSR